MHLQGDFFCREGTYAFCYTFYIIHTYMTIQFSKKQQSIAQIFGIILILVGVGLIFSNTRSKDLPPSKQSNVPQTGSIEQPWEVQEPQTPADASREVVHSLADWLTQSQKELLQETYKKDKNIEIGKSLLKEYLATDDFVAAYDLLAVIKNNKQLTEISPDIVSFVAFNYSIVTPNSDAIKLELLSSPNKDTYAILYSLADKDYATFSSLLEAASKNDSLNKQGIVAAFLQGRQTYRTLRDSPAYYYSGLLAVSLMEGWYTPLTTELAKDILLQDKNYILSYELLSQIAIKEKKYNDAVKYLQVLMKIDAPQIPRTAFFLGMSYYYLKDYNNAVTYLNQVRDTAYAYDAIRYLILIHNNQKQYDTMMDEFRFLLIEQQVDKHDYTLFFDILFYEPYRVGGSSGDFALADKHTLSLVVPYIDACQKQYWTTEPYVCKYWQAWRYLSQNKVDQALKDLIYLSKTYPQPMIFQALGDYYAFQEDVNKANFYYNKALLQENTQ